MRHLITLLAYALAALLVSVNAHAALRPGTSTGPTPDVPPTSWQPPFTIR